MVVSEYLSDAVLAIAVGFTLASMMIQLKSELEREGVGNYYDHIASSLKEDYEQGGYSIVQRSRDGLIRFIWRLLVIDSEKENLT
jgi:hypothetical protein